MKIINNLHNINEDIVYIYISIFDNGNLKYDNVVNKIISLYPDNISFDEILIKVILINQIYNTNIFDVYQLSKDILNIGIDKYIAEGDTNLVYKIANSYKISRNKYCYSFATKYCNFHNEVFPIYDSIVEEVLYQYMLKDRFSIFKKYELRDYNKFINVLVDFKKFYKLDNISYKDLDKFLWQYGKHILKCNT